MIKRGMKKLLILLTCLFVASSVAVYAQEEGDTVTMEETVVTASRIEEPLKYSPDSVTIVTGEEIQKKGKQTVTDVLRDVPGVFIKQSGSHGGEEEIYIRGTNSAHTLIMIDGVQVGDPMKSTGKIKITDISTDNIEKIEIIRGAQSVLYGSDAIGGVINIITKKGRGKPKYYLSAEGGSYETFREKVGVSGSTDKINYAASVSRLDTKGVSKADEELGNTEEDYYHDTNLSTRVGGQISETIRANISVHHSESSMDYDNPGVDVDKVMNTTITSVSTNLDQDLFDWWQHVVKLGVTEVEREYMNQGAFNNSFDGTIKVASWQHNFFIGDIDTVTAGFDYKEEDGDSKSSSGSDIAKKSVDTKGFFIQNKLTPLKGMSFTLGARHDDHQTFGGEDTYKGALAYFSEKTGTKIRGSYATGFRAPSLYQLYSSSGDANLKPEESKGYDAGIDQKLFGEKVSLSLTYFHTKIDNMIKYDDDPAIKKYRNIAKVRTEGWETVLSCRPIKSLSLHAHYTYTEAKNEGDSNNGKYLQYRPQHTGGAAINIKPLEQLNLNLNAQYVGKRYRNDSNTEEMPAYTLFNLAASYDVNKHLQFFGRVENLTDKKYQSVYQYGEPGIGVYGGIKVTF
ncbi:MAG: TonB-dependent receptor [Syntrophales bacterium]|nr:TonB-dependent receptor [Syntrophales bacterium]